MTDSKCRECTKVVRENARGIQCDVCLKWFHLKCTVLSIKEYNYFSKTGDLWICLYCRRDIFPFHTLERDELIDLLVFNSNTECLCSDKISNLKLVSLPSFDISTSINNNPRLLNIDIDMQLPTASNFNYYTTHEFHSSKNIQSTICD